jgi:hypothetical protein
MTVDVIGRHVVSFAGCRRPLLEEPSNGRRCSHRWKSPAPLGRSTDPLLAVTGLRSDLTQAEDTAERLGGGLVAREAAECRAALAAISGLPKQQARHCWFRGRLLHKAVYEDLGGARCDGRGRRWERVADRSLTPASD